MSASKEIFSEEKLRLEIDTGEKEIVVRWLGRSNQRNPGSFIIPRLSEVMKRGIESNKAVVWDFSELDYMNSSTVTPIIKTLEAVKNGSGRVELRYNKAKKWQDLSFSALRIFETRDGRIQVVGEHRI